MNVETSFDDGQVVEQGLHIGRYLLLRISRKETDVAVAQSYDWPRQHDLVVDAMLGNGCCECQQGLSCSGLAREANQFDLRVEKCLQRKGLLCIAWFDAKGNLLVDPLQTLAKSVVVRQNTGMRTLQDEKFIREGLLLNPRLIYRKKIVLVEFCDQGIVEILHLPDSLIEHLDVFHLVVLVILSIDVQGFCFNPEVDILAYQDDLAGGVFVAEILCNGQDTVVGYIFPKGSLELFGVGFSQFYGEFSFSLSQGYAFFDGSLAYQFIEDADKLPGLKIDLIIASFKFVELFQHGDWNDHIVVFEVVDAFTVVQNDIGIEHKGLWTLHKLNLVK